MDVKKGVVHEALLKGVDLLTEEDLKDSSAAANEEKTDLEEIDPFDDGEDFFQADKQAVAVCFHAFQGSPKSSGELVAKKRFSRVTSQNMFPKRLLAWNSIRFSN